ncbi:hypothetical protein FPK90_03960 [Xanthomonas citri pv. glycines]|nr:hypothetical protein BHE84_23300 [Xanthomonas citri pv. glycines str. 8ra]QDR47446.1 hypothetical protein FPK90_03960 [Xanthomonas citri pv. glycines]
MACCAVGCWLLAVGCWLLAVGCWLLAVGCWLLAVGCWPLSTLRAHRQYASRPPRVAPRAAC